MPINVFYRQITVWTERPICAKFKGTVFGQNAIAIPIALGAGAAVIVAVAVPESKL